MAVTSLNSTAKRDNKFASSNIVQNNVLMLTTVLELDERGFGRLSPSPFVPISMTFPRSCLPTNSGDRLRSILWPSS